MKEMIRKMMMYFLILIALLIVVFLFGPREKVDMTIHHRELPENLDAYLAASEAKVPDLIPHTEKKIHWAREAGQKTPLSIVYLHGFSATRQELRPVCRVLSDSLGANVYYTRLKGHGSSGAAMATATVNDWLNDTAEAIEIGRRIGEKMIVIGTSTGGTLATWLAAEQDDADILSYILVSPNFGPRDGSAEVMTWPWARYFAPVLAGETRSWEGWNEEHDLYWTNKYPLVSVIPMMALVKMARGFDLAKFKKPALFIYSQRDQVLNVRKIDTVFAQIGATRKEKIYINNSGDPNHHLIAGDIMSPNTTGPVIDHILGFLNGLASVQQAQAYRQNVWQ